MGVIPLVLEKRRTAGGNSARALGLFAADSPVQKRLMIDAPKDELFRMAMEYSHWRLNPRIIRAFIDKSGDTIRWLEDKGVRFEGVRPEYVNQTPLVYHIPEGGGSAVVQRLLKICEEKGVRLLYETPATNIVVDETGTVTGVVAESQGKEIRIAAKSVIVATGGYGGNEKMLEKYYPGDTEKMKRVGLPHMGDGIRMATEVGAANEGLGILQIGGPSLSDAAKLNRFAQEPRALWVNKRGERYTDEASGIIYCESANAVLRQPEMLSFALYDEDLKRKLIEDIDAMEQIRAEELESELRAQAEKGGAKIADSWDAVAGWMGADPEVLKATIEEYNASCEKGHDALFAKERRYLVALRTPPFYAIKAGPVWIGTIGGIKINEKMQVQNQQDRPIPGLYAGGVDTGGWETETYNLVLSGSTFGFATNSGRIAGEQAVQYISERK
jgi:fumarate reductase flavoprotein subunit